MPAKPDPDQWRPAIGGPFLMLAAAVGAVFVVQLISTRAEDCARLVDTGHLADDSMREKLKNVYEGIGCPPPAWPNLFKTTSAVANEEISTG